MIFKIFYNKVMPCANISWDIFPRNYNLSIMTIYIDNS